MFIKKRKIIVPGMHLYSFGFQPILNQLISKLETDNLWEDSPSIHYGNSDNTIKNEFRRSKQTVLVKHKNVETFDQYLFGLVRTGITDYCKKYKLNIQGDRGYQIIRYQKGDFFEEHYDDINPIQEPRTISILIYLNHQFDGGETFFPHHDIKIKPQTGDMLIFSSSHAFIHKSLPIKSGTKFVVSSFLY